MTLSIQQITNRLSRHSRRALIALFLTGSMISSIAFAADESVPINRDTAPPAVQVESDASANALDYWIFSDDYCGWASAEVFATPYSVDPFATVPARNRFQADSAGAIDSVANVVDRALATRQRQEAMAADLAELAKSEPIDVTVSDKVSAASRPGGPLCGSSPMIASIAEGYLPYDLGRDDQISLRMYPVTIPQFNYVGADRLLANGTGGLGPMDCLGYGVIWNEAVAPSQSVETTTQPDYFAAMTEVWNGAQRLVAAAINDATLESEAQQAAIALAIIDAIQPDSEARRSVSPLQVGREVGAAFLTVCVSAQSGLQEMTDGIASWSFEEPQSQTVEAETTAGEKLLVRAGIEADAWDCATAGVADVEQSVCCPVERWELAAQPPATFQMAAVGVAAATLSMPQEPQQLQREEITRAEAIATACDSTAATLERLAMALRKAGDSVIRVARASVEDGTDLR